MKSSSDTEISNSSDIGARLDRIESLVEHILYGQRSSPKTHEDSPWQQRNVETDQTLIESEVTESHGAFIRSLSSAVGEGTLLVENGESHFVSSQHWALLAEKVNLFNKRRILFFFLAVFSSD
jgi:hypothetical protein